jgi:hypothetical protein
VSHEFGRTSDFGRECLVDLEHSRSEDIHENAERRGVARALEHPGWFGEAATNTRDFIAQPGRYGS